MRIKIGEQWFECQPGQPIMIELTAADKSNIAHMHPDATKYAVFADDEPAPISERLAWME